MREPRHPANRRPTPGQFAAYADGGLSRADEAAVEAWLAAHPEDRAEVEAQRRLLRLWRAAEPPAPSPKAWAETFARIEHGLAQPATPPAAPRPWLRPLGLALGTAAALLLTASLARYFAPGAPLPVAATGDVEIVSMDADDTRALVVGTPPVQGPLTLASAQDVTVDDTGHDVEVLIPDTEPPGGPPAPMMMVPLDPGSRE